MTCSSSPKHEEAKSRVSHGDRGNMRGRKINEWFIQRGVVSVLSAISRPKGVAEPPKGEAAFQDQVVKARI